MKLVEPYLTLREHRRDGAKVAHLVERSHRTDDKFLAKVQNEGGFFRKGAGWVCHYNLKRPHHWGGDGGETSVFEVTGTRV